ncbi:RNA-binding protein [Terrilactibacillus sp. BCM23-1]|uniref:RNA-binding protein n=1 Tax=Terrilactibacillus tamarindi TaxID=2599694 RepID=A0A6N8CPD3_9BACI|nr:RNA-binding protein [Terrilactibacillus tamarindi]MTT32029.1 RNA-binding protein [Terrilactibacillus tamarindi]
MTLYDHFRKEERPFIDHVLDWKEQVEMRYQPKLTEFLDPRQQEMIRLVIGNNEDVNITFFGGYKEAERARAFLYPSYIEPSEDNFDIACFELRYATKFVQIEHPKLLGSLLHLGLIRDKFGDLLVADGRAQFIVTKEVSDYIKLNLTHVGKSPVQAEIIKPNELLHISLDWKETTGTVSSMRLDTVLSEVYRMSRTKATEYIDHLLVKVNWKVIEKNTFELKTGDILSVRGKGRCKIIQIEGFTKKDKIRIRYGKLD